MPRYLYLSEPGSRWQLANDVDIAELRAQLAKVRFGTVHTHVIVEGVQWPLTIHDDEVHPHAIVDLAGTQPRRSPSRRMMSSFSRSGEMFQTTPRSEGPTAFKPRGVGTLGAGRL